MTNKLFLYLIITFISLMGLGITTEAKARVIISEIAWMGDSENANHEWIEITNNYDSSVDLEGWQLTALDGSPNILLEGVIEPGESRVLERTSEESAPGIALTIYTGALSNSGETLQLKNKSGEIEDEAGGEPEWLAGDNVTKETMNRSADFSHWVTLLASPGTHESKEEEGDSEETLEQQHTEIKNAPKQEVLTGSLEIPKTVFTKERFTLRATLMNDDTELEHGNIIINFGDGNFVDTGNSLEKVTYQYQEPGEYLIRFEIRANPWQPEPTQEGSKIIEVIDSTIQITPDKDRLVITNKKELDISGWSLSINKEKMITLPPLTKISKEPFYVNPETSNIEEITLIDNQGITRAILKNNSQPKEERENIPTTTTTTNTKESKKITSRQASSASVSIERTDLIANTLSGLKDTSKPDTTKSFPWWPLGLSGLILSSLGVSGFLLSQHEQDLND